MPKYKEMIQRIIEGINTATIFTFIYFKELEINAEVQEEDNPPDGL